MAQVQKKTSTVSLTISPCTREPASSTVIQQDSSLDQPLCNKPQRNLSPSCSHQAGVAPTLIKSLHDMSTVKGQLVVLECHLRGTPPLQVLWYREDEQIVDSADFRILRKKASSTSVPELCTLVITEAIPEDSGIFKCIAGNPFGTISCSCFVEVHTDLENVLADEDEFFPGPGEAELDDFPSLVQDAVGIPPPKWQESPNEMIQTLPSESEDESTAMPCRGTTEQVGQVSSETVTTPCSPSSVEIKNSVAKPFTPPCKLNNVDVSSGSMNVANLPTFLPSLYPPSAFNYERPSHFIQSQSNLKSPDSMQANRNTKASSPPPTSSWLISSKSSSQTVSPPKCYSETALSRVSSAQLGDRTSQTINIFPAPRQHSPSMRGSPVSPHPVPKSTAITCTSPVSTLQVSPSPAPSSISPSLPKTMSPPQQKTYISLPVGYNQGTTNVFPKPILKKTTSRPVSHSTDEEIQGSKDALIQDLERKLRSKEVQRRKSCQKFSYEERMARRLLGPNNAAGVFEVENSSYAQQEQPDSAEGRHMAGIWSKQLPGTDGNESAATTLEKCYAPRFIQVPQDLTMEEGRFCRIDFKVVGLPAPDVAWYLDGKAIRQDDYHKMLVSEKGIHSFIIEIVTVHHAGIYECVAKNRAGESRFSLRLDVIAQEMIRPPSFVMRMQNIRVIEGDMVRLECQVFASPPPQLFWKKDKEMLRIDPSRMSLTQDNSGQLCLLIDQVKKSDAGWYTVSAINEAGMSTCNARLDVGTYLNKVPAHVKPVKMHPIVNQLSALGPENSTHHTAPLYESEEL
ncbi:myotilin isoform X2 [Alosa sapidissima]|uniref:myotilin isoform X2 n=1 Tax=Alosa sapidissima TaxID=34773 RepID=UPI001C0895F4|nr:myotilin isoform X2 [Alosa sapidissima]